MQNKTRKYLLELDWGLCFVSADDEKREENGEQTAAGGKSARFSIGIEIIHYSCCNNTEHATFCQRKTLGMSQI